MKISYRAMALSLAALSLAGITPFRAAEPVPYRFTSGPLSAREPRQVQAAETVLFSFGGGRSGAYPYGSLIADSNGALYGTTYEGGGDCPGFGTVFKLTLPSLGASAGGSCNALCFRAPEYFLGRLNQLPRGTVLVAGNGLNTSISTDHLSELQLALDGGNSAQDRFNRYFVAAQLGLLAAPGTNQGALASRLECYRMDFNPIRLSNGSILSPSAPLGTLLEQSRQAARGGNPADLEALSRLLQVLTGDDPAGRCSAGGRLP